MLWSLESVHVVSLRKAVLPSTQLKDEDRAKGSELQTWRDSTQMITTVLCPPESSQHSSVSKAYTAHG